MSELSGDVLEAVNRGHLRPRPLSADRSEVMSGSVGQLPQFQLLLQDAPMQSDDSDHCASAHASTQCHLSMQRSRVPDTVLASVPLSTLPCVGSEAERRGGFDDGGVGGSLA